MLFNEFLPLSLSVELLPIPTEVKLLTFQLSNVMMVTRRLLADTPSFYGGLMEEMEMMIDRKIRAP